MARLLIPGGTDRSNKAASSTGFGINDDAIHTAYITVTRSSSTVMGLSLTLDAPPSLSPRQTLPH
ncbi:hypothetical protein [Verrucomicrobium spinosum]|uniref:hypothetical protein n=1 Tax=Verrucomicrobium spinosum TaxID=2736 RepID=UPI0001745B79|nr:hypothetical protein [Verrucomicrobium spinosum]